MDEKLLALPWQIQLALGAGYVAYMLAYVGIRDQHKAADTTFRAIAFGLVATVVLYLAEDKSRPIQIGCAVSATLLSGLLWRIVGIDLSRWLLYKTDVSWADDAPSAWATVTSHNSHSPVSQISVLLDDGTWLNCNLNARFNESPFGPCVLGPTGDVALYVTDEVSALGKVEVHTSVQDDDYGDRITYVPANRIVRVTLRHKPI